MDIKDALTERFTEAIQRALPRCTPLIGPKWCTLYPNGKPADFQFTGCGKLAKATTMRPEKILAKILANLAVDDLAASVEATEDHKINVTLIAKTDKADKADKADKPEDPSQ